MGVLRQVHRIVKHLQSLPGGCAKLPSLGVLRPRQVLQLCLCVALQTTGHATLLVNWRDGLRCASFDGRVQVHPGEGTGLDQISFLFITLSTVEVELKFCSCTEGINPKAVAIINHLVQALLK